MSKNKKDKPGPVCEVSHNKRFKFACPACNLYHVIPISGPNSWKWNGSLNKPTLSPSLDTLMEFGDDKEKRKCHLFIENGEIQYCNDCTHKMAGQTILMVPVKVSKESSNE